MFLGTIFLLSLTQGITEFLPISSSGHLILFPFFIDLTYQGKTFDVVLHFGSLLGVIFYLKKDIIKILNDMNSKERFSSQGFKIMTSIFFATLPVIVVGYLFNFYEIKLIKLIQVIGWTTLIFGIILGIADKIKIERRSFPRLKDSIIIGLLQAISIIPGVSRSGIVITTGRFLGYNRIQSSKFSLLLSIPVIFAAMSLKFLDSLSVDSITFSLDLLVGFFLSTIFSFLTIKLFMSYIEKASLQIFVIYRIILGFIILYFAYS